jgi:hypothetical protein
MSTIALEKKACALKRWILSKKKKQSNTKQTNQTNNQHTKRISKSFSKRTSAKDPVPTSVVSDLFLLP